MEKNPADRYATAQELADDLERYLRDEPIRAKRPTLVQRARKWSRRHQPVVTTAAAAAALLVLLVLSGLMISNRAITAEQARTEEALKAALQAEDRARTAEKDAVAQRDLALKIVLAENRATTLVGMLRTLGEKHAETRQSAYDLALALEKRGDLEAAAGTYASWGFWTDADRTYRSLMQSQPGTVGHWWAFAIVSLARHERESYRRTCQ